ncbi:MAG: hypothetical protein HC769_26560 [Cyanobacteria bacterium CRU_2_1]|nr:hypothetical protein [Cyanobacteria bacterium CRU_2_1]
MQVLHQTLPIAKFSFTNGQTAQAINVQDHTQLPTALRQLGLIGSHPVLVVVGGANNLEPPDYDRLQHLFLDSLAPLAQELGMVIVDGGTNSGVMKLMGQARSTIHASFPLIGVAPSNKVYLPNQPQTTGTHPLEPHHTHFILTPGSKWGDESPWIAAIASLLSGDSPSVTVLLNGGNVSLIDVRESVAEGRPVVVIAGTGRLADKLATALAPEADVPEELSPVIREGRFALFDVSKPTARFKSNLKHYFSDQYSRLQAVQML